MKNNKKTISNIFIGVALAIALAFSACDIDPDVDTTSPSNGLLREQTAYEDSLNATIDSFIDESSVTWIKNGINVGTNQTYPLTTKKPISLTTLQSALKWSTLKNPLTETPTNIDPPYEYLAQDSLHPDITQVSEHEFLISFKNIPKSVSQKIELHVAAAEFVTAAGGKIDTNQDGIPGQPEDDVYVNIDVENSESTPLDNGVSERDPWNTQDISGSISSYQSSPTVMNISITITPSKTAFDNVLGYIKIEQSDDGVNWVSGPDLPALSNTISDVPTTRNGQKENAAGKFYRLVANNAWELNTDDTYINGFIQHYYGKNEEKKQVLDDLYTIGAHLSTEIIANTSDAITAEIIPGSNNRNNVVKLKVTDDYVGFVAGVNDHPENFRVLINEGKTRIPIKSAKVLTENPDGEENIVDNNVVVLTLDPAYELTEDITAVCYYIGPDVAVKVKEGSAIKYFNGKNKSNEYTTATPNVPAFFTWGAVTSSN